MNTSILDEATRTPQDQEEITNKEGQKQSSNNAYIVSFDLWLQHPFTKKLIDTINSNKKSSESETEALAKDFGLNANKIQYNLNVQRTLNFVLYLIDNNK